MSDDRQPGLFTGINDQNHVGYVGGSDTSKAAAIDVAPLTGAMRVRVFDWAARQRSGFTCDEAEIALTLKHQTCSARVRELVKLGFVVDSGERRATSSGRAARIYVLTDRRPS